QGGLLQRFEQRIERLHVSGAPERRQRHAAQQAIVEQRLELFPRDERVATVQRVERRQTQESVGGREAPADRRLGGRPSDARQRCGGLTCHIGGVGQGRLGELLHRALAPRLAERLHDELARVLRRGGQGRDERRRRGLTELFEHVERGVAQA